MQSFRITLCAAALASGVTIVSRAALSASEAAPQAVPEDVSGDAGDTEEAFLYSLAMHPDFRDDKKKVLRALERNPDDFSLVSERLRGDKEVALAALRPSRSYNTTPLQYVSAALCDDEDIVAAAVTHSLNGFAMAFASPRLKADKKFVLRLLSAKDIGSAIRVLSEDLRNDREVAIRAVCSSPRALQFIPDRFKDDSEVVLAAIAANVGNYDESKWISNRLRDDRELVATALKKGWRIFPYASPRLRDEKEIALLALALAGEDLQWASARLRDDEDVVARAMATNSNALRYASDRLKGKR